MNIKSNYIREGKTEDIAAILRLCKLVVSKYSARGVIPGNACEDVEMAVMEKFLIQRSKIDGAFEGRSGLSTYYSAVINKMCCEVIRKESKHWYSLNEASEEISCDAVTDVYETEKHVVFKGEQIRLKTALRLFCDGGAKATLFLKFFFDIPPTDTDIAFYSEIHKDFISDTLHYYKDSGKGEKFRCLAEIVNRVEGKSIEGDAVRMWLQKQIDIVLLRLNQNGMANHTLETLKILFEMAVYN